MEQRPREANRRAANQEILLLLQKWRFICGPCPDSDESTTHLVTAFLTNPINQALEKLTVRSASQEIPRLSWNQKIYYGIRNSLHRSLYWARWIQYTLSQHVFPRYILMLPSHLRLALLNGLFPSVSQLKFCVISHFRHAHHSPNLFHPLRFYLPKYLVNSTNYAALQYSIFSSLSSLSSILDPNILLTTLFSNAPSLCSSLTMTSSLIPIQSNRRHDIFA